MIILGALGPLGPPKGPLGGPKSIAMGAAQKREPPHRKLHFLEKLRPVGPLGPLGPPGPMGSYGGWSS